MTNPNSILKSKDITLLTKVCIVKAMVFPVVTYGCESWTTKAECQKIDAFELWCWRLLRVPWAARKSNQSVLKEINPEYSLKGLKLKLQYFGHLMWRADSLEKILMLGKIEGRRRRRWQKMRLLDSTTHQWTWIGTNSEIVKDREAWHATVHEVARNWTLLSDWAKTTAFEWREEERKEGKKEEYCIFFPVYDCKHLEMLDFDKLSLFVFTC